MHCDLLGWTVDQGAGAVCPGNDTSYGGSVYDKTEYGHRQRRIRRTGKPRGVYIHAHDTLLITRHAHLLQLGRLSGLWLGSSRVILSFCGYEQYCPFPRRVNEHGSIHSKLSPSRPS